MQAVVAFARPVLRERQSAGPNCLPAAAGGLRDLDSKGEASALLLVQALASFIGDLERPRARLAHTRIVTKPCAGVGSIEETMSNYEEGLCSINAAAEFLSVTVSTVRRLIASGELATVRIGGRRLIARDTLNAFVAARVERTGSGA